MDVGAIAAAAADDVQTAGGERAARAPRRRIVGDVGIADAKKELQVRHAGGVTA